MQDPRYTLSSLHLCTKVSKPKYFHIPCLWLYLQLDGSFPELVNQWRKTRTCGFVTRRRENPLWKKHCYICNTPSIADFIAPELHCRGESYNFVLKLKLIWFHYCGAPVVVSPSHQTFAIINTMYWLCFTTASFGFGFFFLSVFLSVVRSKSVLCV